ncbi:hypothetical protein C9374_007226 [Naegleria lovaniensis]|uniref:FAD synthase n=1 Tax=Naegleria lovaniensis TaxID=51637 RepID=A0AA88GZA2_NAELO|nr:uncharacterized protein C9374_007226 [Naegleria lovaniensis]KAG2393695.1 hypothetical protein C9374_007226 [Naegleria lovaniensis]
MLPNSSSEQQTSIICDSNDYIPTTSSANTSPSCTEYSKKGTPWFLREKSLEYCYSELSKHPSLLEKVQKSIEIIKKTLEMYNTPIALGFNGGKDSVVIVNLLIMYLLEKFKVEQCTAENSASSSLQQLSALLNQHCLFFHFSIPHQFPEMDQFLEQSSKLYGVTLKLIDASKGFKQGLVELIETSSSKLDAVFMGTRKIDPDGRNIDVFEKTSDGWPEMMRVSPILEWDYQDVWQFILTLHIPYCTLYDMGYTSLGSVNDTVRNEALRQPDDSFLPAYFLMDGTLERFGRMKK